MVQCGREQTCILRFIPAPGDWFPTMLSGPLPRSAALVSRFLFFPLSAAFAACKSDPPQFMPWGSGVECLCGAACGSADFFLWRAASGSALPLLAAAAGGPDACASCAGKPLASAVVN